MGLSWDCSEADTGTKVQVPVVCWGDQAKKHQKWGGEVRQEEKKAIHRGACYQVSCRHGSLELSLPGKLWDPACHMPGSHLEQGI